MILPFIVPCVALAKPARDWMHVLYARDRLPLSGLERGLYRLAGIDPKAEQSWIGWTTAMMVFNVTGIAFLFAVSRQHQCQLAKANRTSCCAANRSTDDPWTSAGADSSPPSGEPFSACDKGWCGRSESNRHSFRNRILSRVYIKYISVIIRLFFTPSQHV